MDRAHELSVLVQQIPEWAVPSVEAWVEPGFGEGLLQDGKVGSARGSRARSRRGAPHEIRPPLSSALRRALPLPGAGELSREDLGQQAEVAPFPVFAIDG